MRLPNLERTFAMLYISLFLIKLHNFGIGWPLVNVFQELLDSICRALSLTFDLQSRRLATVGLRYVDTFTFSLSVFLTQPVIPASVAFFRVNDRKFTPERDVIC